MGDTFPNTQYQAADCVLVPINKALIPYVAGALKMYERRGWWATDQDWEYAYNAFAALEIAMAGNCVTDLIESNNRIYRLLDTIFNGAQYAAFGNPPVISPEIPAVPDGNDFEAPGLRRQLLDMQGEIDEWWFGIGGRPATIADLVAAMRRTPENQATAIDSALDTLDGIDDATDVINTVRGLFATGEDVVADGAQLVLTGASGVGTIAMLGILATMLRQHRLLLSDIKDLLSTSSSTEVLEKLEEIKTLLA